MQLSETLARYAVGRSPIDNYVMAVRSKLIPVTSSINFHIMSKCPFCPEVELVAIMYSQPMKILIQLNGQLKSRN